MANVGGFTVTTYTAAGAPTTPTISLFNPICVAVDLQDNIYVTNGTSFYLYAADGTLTGTFPAPNGTQPYGIAVF